MTRHVPLQKADKISEDQVQLSRCRKSSLATKLENLLNYVKLFVVSWNRSIFQMPLQGFFQVQKKKIRFHLVVFGLREVPLALSLKTLQFTSR